MTIDLSPQRVDRNLTDLRRWVRETPIWTWRGGTAARHFGKDTEVVLKLELFQHAGSFKVRGALTIMAELSAEQLERGVTAASAGNHAMAVSFAAKMYNTTAKVVMPKTASPMRIQRSRDYGAKVVLVDNIHQVFDRVHEIERDEQRHLIHPFDGPGIALGTSTLGLEFLRQAGQLDAVLVPVGGGGLIAGMSSLIKQVSPRTQVFGVEPKGAPTLTNSFAANKPVAIDAVTTIADSLGAPHAKDFSFNLCQRNVDDIVTIDDDELRRSMALLFRNMKLAVEPAAAASTAALAGPLRRRLDGKRVGLIVCGSNIDVTTFQKHVEAGNALL